MHPAIRLSTIMLAGLAGLVAILMIVWPGWTLSLQSGKLSLPWDSGRWSQVLVAPDGGSSSPVANGYLLVAVTLLLTAALVAASFDLLMPVRRLPLAAEVAVPPPAIVEVAQSPSSTREVDKEVSVEIGKVLTLLRTQLEANGLHGTVLATANAQLPAATKPEQLRMIISYLMVENDNMRNRTRALQTNLEASRRQIDSLKTNLAVAKAEVMSDGLTNLKNRRGFDLTLAAELAQARDDKQPMSLIMTDIDHFKAVNDRLGHPAGDEVLRWFARVLASNIKGRDTVARYGGEEFAIILPRTNLDHAAQLAGQLKSVIEGSVWSMPGAEQTKLRVTASFGVAEWQKGESSDALLRRADANLYGAKLGGRNRVIA